MLGYRYWYKFQDRSDQQIVAHRMGIVGKDVELVPTNLGDIYTLLHFPFPNFPGSIHPDAAMPVLLGCICS